MAPRSGILSLRPGTIPSSAPPLIIGHPGDPAWQKSVSLWNWQLGFDGRLHEERGLAWPADFAASDERRGESLKEWILGATFAFLEELVELDESRAHALDHEDGARVELVDTLHFVLMAAQRTGMTVEQLGRFEDRFEEGLSRCRRDGVTEWKQAWRRYLPEYIMALRDLNGGLHKWWKAQPPQPNLEKAHAAIVKIHALNLAIASQAFPDAQAMFDVYAAKVQVNHARQDGTIASRSDYQAPDLKLVAAEAAAAFGLEA
jgi:hypothetical protein